MDRPVVQTALEILKRCIRSAKAVGKLDLREARVQVDDPFFQPWKTAGLLGAESPAVKGVGVGDDDTLLGTGDFESMRPGELDRAFHCFRSGSEQEDFLERLGQKTCKPLHQARSNLAGKTIACQQP